MANVLSDTYPISRQLYWYTAGPAEGPVKALLDWVVRSRRAKKSFQRRAFIL